MINIHSRPKARTAKLPPSKKPKRRHPAGGGYARGGETRTRIVTAALDVFGAHGFGGTSTRMIAKQAGVALPVLQYYFDGKEGPYLACAEHIADRLETRLGPAIINPFDILYNRMMQRTLLTCAEIVARLLKKPAKHPDVRIRTFALVVRWSFSASHAKPRCAFSRGTISTTAVCAW